MFTPLFGVGHEVPPALLEVVQALESVELAWKLFADPAFGATIVNPQRMNLLKAYLPDGLSTVPVVWVLK